MSIKLPAYVYDDPEGKSLREQIVQELKLSEGDGRKAWLLQKSCEIAFAKLTAKLMLGELIKVCMSDRNCVVRSEAGLKTTLEEMFEAMRRQYYCQIQKGSDGNVLSVILVEPWIGKADDYLGLLYGRNKGYAYEKSSIYQIAVFPMLGQLANKLSIRENILSDMCKELQTSTFVKENVDILENRVRFSGLVKINFEEQDLGGGFHIILSGSDQFSEFIKNGIIVFLVHVIRKNVTLDSTLKDAIRVKQQQTSAVTASSVSSSGTQGDEVIAEKDNWELWISPLKKILIDYRSKNLLEKVFSKSFTNQYGNIEKIFLFIIKAVVIANRYYELRQMEQVEGKERELGLEQDRLHMEKILINSGKIIRDDENIAISLYQPMSLNAFFYSKDRLGQKKLIERYTTAELNQIVATQNPDKKHTQILSIKDASGNIFFIHLWRLSDVMLSMIQLEAPGLTAKILKKFSKENFPRPEFPIVDKSDVSPLFLAVYSLAMKVFSSFSTQQEALEHLFPSASDVNTYNLGSSEIGSMTRDTELARKKFLTTLDFLFENGNSSTPQPLEKVLGLNRAYIEEKLGVQTNTKKKSGLFELASTILWDFLTLKWITNIGKIAMTALDAVAPNEANPVVAPDFEQPDVSKIRIKEAGRPVSKKILFEDLRSQIPSIPPSRKEIQTLIESKHEEWNVAIEDPQAYFPNWNEMGLLEKQRVQDTLRSEIEKRRRVTRDVVDSSLVKYYSNLDIKGFDEIKFNTFCENVAKEFKTNRPSQLKEYIKYFLIYMNTN